MADTLWELVDPLTCGGRAGRHGERDLEPPHPDRGAGEVGPAGAVLGLGWLVDAILTYFMCRDPK